MTRTAGRRPLDALRARPNLVTVALVVLAAVTWFGWFAHEEYVTSPEGNVSGPYVAWQVLGAVLTLAVLVVVGARTLDVPLAATWVTIGFAGGFAVKGAMTDDTGLYLVGTLLVGVGTFVGALVVGWLASLPGRDDALA
jgi:hypothetical protein